MDRTNWKFGELNVNELVIAVIYQGISFPLMFKLLPKARNSNTHERIVLIKRFISLLGIQALGCLTADRELIDDYLNYQNIRYYPYPRELLGASTSQWQASESLMNIFQFAIKQLSGY
jgi:hypothetical protein